jgi:DNA-binding NtrC family response regulator
MEQQRAIDRYIRRRLGGRIVFIDGGGAEPQEGAGGPKVVSELLGESRPIQALRLQVERVLRRQRASGKFAPVLIQGETGTGKGLLARALHRASGRAAGPFVDVDCGSLPETLLESELFGHIRGAFTDARYARTGLFQAANGGTLFLDEIGLLPRALQHKLLKAVEEREVRRLGSTQREPVDVWIIAATNENLDEGVTTGAFRRDLFHRLAAVSISLPPLRARGRDVVLLAEHFLARAVTGQDLGPKWLSPDAWESLLAHGWPGNVRELAHLIERLVMEDEHEISAAVVARVMPIQESRPRPRLAPLRQARDLFERDKIEVALRQSGGSLSAAAARLGMARNTLRYRLKKLGLLDAPDAAGPGVPPVAASTADPVPMVERTGAVASELCRVALLAVWIPGYTAPLVHDLVEEWYGHLPDLGGQRLLERDGQVLIGFGLDRRPLIATAAAEAAHSLLATWAASPHLVHELPPRVVLTVEMMTVLGHGAERTIAAADLARACQVLDGLRPEPAV